MSFSISRHARPYLGTTFVVGAVAGALARHAPPRAADACRAAAARSAPTVAHGRTSSSGEVARDDRCADPQLPPLAIAAAALAMLAVPRARQGGVMEL